MRTGIDIISSGHVPHSDPYSFTAAGHTWIVQSWLAEVTYGVAHRIGGYHAVVLVQGILMGLIALVVACLARTGDGKRTLLAAGISVMSGILLWSSRPLLFGLLGMALLILIVERRRNPLWLIPLIWVWVNTHGSFPFAAAWLGVVYIGAFIDTRHRPKWLEPYLLAGVAGFVVSLANPYGIKLLTFPLVVGRNRSVFQQIIEWRSPNFQSGDQLTFLVLFALGLVILARTRASWRDLLPVVAFLVAGLVSERNLAAASIVIAAPLARALRTSASSLPGVRRSDGLPPVAIPASIVAAIALIFIGWRSNALDLNNFPVAGNAYLASHGLLTGHRIATFDITGDYEGFVQGPHHEVFIDDRYDMYPASVVHDAQALETGRAPSLDVLQRWNIDVVLWLKGQGPGDYLQAAGGWHLAWSDSKWEILTRTT
jgi:hypothetical protein